jgi:MSHA biogenesis protein MshO
MRYERGFTLVELVVTIVLSAIVVTFMALFLVAPVDGYVAQERRTELADSADNAMRMLDNDIHNAVPESVRHVRIGSIVTLELLLALDVARYRKSGDGGGAPQELDFSTPENQFYTVGTFANLGHPSGIRYLVVGHTGAVGQDAYAMANVITPANTANVNVSATPDEDVITLAPPTTFTSPSPSSKVFAVQGPVAYVCNETAHTLTRFQDYPISSPIAGQIGLGTSSLVARDITSCAFNHVPGTPQRGTLVTSQLILARNGEILNVMHESQVENLP